MSTAPLERISESLRTHARIDACLAAPSAIRTIVDERARASRCGTLDEYAALVERSPEERSRLRELVTVPETWLFRYPASYELLRTRLAERRDRPFRALSVACATGAEPACIVMAAMAAGLPPEAITVEAIDPNPSALAVARAGRWSRMALRDAPPAWAAQWLRTDATGVSVAPEVLARIRFAEGTAPEALAAFAAGSFDGVWCRNLAIYLAPDARRAIGARLIQLLAPDGLLFLGHAEPAGVFGLDEQVTPAAGGTFAFERTTAGAGAAPAQRTQGRIADAASARSSAPLAAPSTAGAARRPVPVAPPRPAAAPGLDDARRAANVGRVDEALAIAEGLHRAGDRSTGLLELLGTLHAARGDVVGAERFLRQVLYLDPDHTEALLHLALLADGRGDTGLAHRYRARAAKEAG
jgi:chemotaxis protein methyltransferase WspC